MALTCVRCGTQNPDGNAYCQACGTPLSAPAGVTTGALPGPPPGPPPVYQTPYYAPSAPTAPVHRTPWMLIIGVVVVLTIVMAGFGTALAVLGNRGSQNSPSGGIADVPSPTPGLTPSPVASPTSTQAATGLQTNDGFSLTVPSGWVVESKDNESMVLSDPNTEGSVTVASGVSIPTQTAQQNKDTVESALRSKYTDAKSCPNSKASNGSFSGASGIAWTLCFTITSGANSLVAAASLFAGANASGTVYYLVMVLTSQNNLVSYLNTSKPLLQTVHWKLS